MLTDAIGHSLKILMKKYKVNILKIKMIKFLIKQYS
jgi:hypothetical protein